MTVEVTQLITQFILRRKEDIEIFNVKKQNSFGEILDGELYEECRAIFEVNNPQKEPERIILDICNGDWNSEDMSILVDMLSDDYYRLFKRIKGPDLSYIIHQCLKFGGQSGYLEKECLKIYEVAREALIKIAKESDINKERVKLFGIDVDEITLK